MKKNLFVTLFLSAFVLPTWADTSGVLTLVNHYTGDLNFSVGINPETLPNLKGVLKAGQTKETKVVNGPEAYVRGSAANNHFAFFGVEPKENNTIQIYGYLSQGIAFSWGTGPIIFCTHDVYIHNGNKCV